MWRSLFEALFVKFWMKQRRGDGNRRSPSGMTTRTASAKDNSATPHPIRLRSVQALRGWQKSKATAQWLVDDYIPPFAKSAKDGHPFDWGWSKRKGKALTANCAVSFCVRRGIGRGISGGRRLGRRVPGRRRRRR